MSLKYEPASEPLHISVKELFLNGSLMPPARSLLEKAAGKTILSKYGACKAVEAHHHYSLRCSPALLSQVFTELLERESSDLDFGFNAKREQLKRF